MRYHDIDIDERELAAFCRRHGVRRLALFGSILRDDFGPDSDIDVLVEFEPGRTPGLAFFRMESELTGMFGRKVDLNTLGFLGPRIGKHVLSEARVAYEAA